MDRWNVGILLFDGVEVLDFAGPYEVFSRTRTVPGSESRRSETAAPFRVFTVARMRATIVATGGLRVEPDFGFDDAPPIHLLLVPGGFGTRPLLEDRATLDWIAARSRQARLTTSVCTGALLLAKSGVLAGHRATTHHAALDLLATLHDPALVERTARVVEDGVITSAGVSAGIDLSFRVVERLCGRAVAEETAHYIEYPIASGIVA
jgi:transcriptional regulator GlxA family with amidase domain